MTNATPTAKRSVVARGYARSASPDSEAAYALRAVIYLRVSTIGQVRTNRDSEGFSIAAQREACLRKIDDLGAVFVDEYIDAGESARSADRAQLQALLNRLATERDIDLVVVHKVDRLARNRADDVQITLAIKKSGARLVSVTENIDETPSGMLVHGIMSSIAEFYSQNLATEISKGMDQKVKKGGLAGRAPIGYLNVQNFDGHSSKPIRSVVIDPERAPLVRWAFEAYASGDYTIKQLTEALTEKGLTTRPTRVKAAMPLYPQHVHDMLTKRVYVGLVQWKGIEYPGTNEPLVSIETFATVQALLHSRAQAHEKPSKHQHYLRGSLFCKRCASPMGFVRAKGRSAEYDYFFCWSRARGAGCDLPYLPAEVIENQVEACYEPVQVSAVTVLRFKEFVLKHMKLRIEGAEKEARKNRKRILDLESERRRLLQAHLAGAVPLDLLREEQDRITRQLAQAGAELANLEVDWEQVEENVNAAVALASQLFDIYLTAEPTLRRRINQACWDGFDLDADGVVGARLSDPMAALVADDLVKQLGAENGNRDPFERGRGSRLTSLVEVSGLEPPTSTLRTWLLRPFDQDHSKELPGERLTFDSRCLMLHPLSAR
jgi:site-specific DNA recombinase